MKAARLPSGLCREATTRQRFGLYQPRSYPQTWLTALAAGCAMAAGVHARVAEADTVDLATHQPPREIEHGRSGALSSRHLGGVGLAWWWQDLQGTMRPRDYRGSAAERRAKAGIGF